MSQSTRLVLPAKVASPRSSAERNLAKIVPGADASKLIRQMLRGMFEREEHFDLRAEVMSGQEAIELALQHRPRTIIPDLSTPVLNGLNAARELKPLMPGGSIIPFTDCSGPGSA